ncbi:glycosyltransferase family 4 protein [Chitinophaga sp.]|uniref:MraY family glycosyltransferase n=1 Tax=Chitinophaga sp. TaxID=1869181 RepID=UPI0031D09BC8
MNYLILGISLFLLILIYFRLADHFNIIDKPNERSSHKEITIRGGGIIFLFAGLALLVDDFTTYWPFVAGLLMIGVISFLDDVFTLSNRIRIIFHIAAVSLLFYFLSVFTLNIVWVVCLYVFVIGIINAYNFMDGINGITGLYSLVVLLFLQYVNLSQVHFVGDSMIWYPAIACVVFLVFNFRKKAKCFAGDVGSVTIAFWIAGLLLQLIIHTGNYTYILFLAIYGVDTILTIIHRLYLRQNIFKAHRLHFYQILANDRKIPHLYVSTLYAILQAFVCVIVILNGSLFSFVGVIIPLVIIYVALKPRLMKSAVV